jgi:hypothetical protein
MESWLIILARKRIMMMEGQDGDWARADGRGSSGSVKQHDRIASNSERKNKTEE